MSPTQAPQHFTPILAEHRVRALAGFQHRTERGPCSRSGHIGPEGEWGRVHASVSCTPDQAGRVPAIGCIVATHRAELSSPALRVAARVLSDQGLTAPLVVGVRRLVSHTTRPEQRGKEDTMNR